MFFNVQLNFKKGLLSWIFSIGGFLTLQNCTFRLVTFTFLSKGQKCSKIKIVKKCIEKWKMKSKAIVLILGESLKDQGGVGFFVPTQTQN